MKMTCAALSMLMTISAFADETEISEDYVPQAAFVEASVDEEIDEAAFENPPTATGALTGATTTALPSKSDNALSNECVKSVSLLYRFYFHEIYPNPKNEACKNQPATLAEKEAAEMQKVISDVKKHCPAPFVSQVNASFRELKTERDA